MADVLFDNQEQYDRIVPSLLPGEEVLAVYDAIGGGIGFIGVTSWRVILQDNSFVGKKVALTSLPLQRCQRRLVRLGQERVRQGRQFKRNRGERRCAHLRGPVPRRRQGQKHHDLILSHMREAQS